MWTVHGALTELPATSSPSPLLIEDTSPWIEIGIDQNDETDIILDAQQFNYVFPWRI